MIIFSEPASFMIYFMPGTQSKTSSNEKSWSSKYEIVDFLRGVNIYIYIYIVRAFLVISKVATIFYHVNHDDWMKKSGCACHSIRISTSETTFPTILFRLFFLDISTIYEHDTTRFNFRETIFVQMRSG